MIIADIIHKIVVKRRIGKMIELFRDAYEQMKTDEKLRKSISESVKHQKCIPEKEAVDSFFDKKRYEEACEVTIVDKRTFEAAGDYRNDHLCVLNFACSTDPGGGVTKGSIAQEEALCRCSTLYPCLKTSKMKQEFYEPHIKEQYFLSHDDCIYTPNVVVFRTDEFYPQPMQEDDWFKSDVITCAAPALHRTELNGNSLYELHYKRMIRILDIAALEKCDVIILGAFGCGAFKNEPHIVAEAIMNVVKHYRFCFKKVVFAIPTIDGCEKNENFRAFYYAVNNFFRYKG